MKKLLSAMSLILGLGLATAQQTAPATSTTAHQPAKVMKPFGCENNPTLRSKGNLPNAFRRDMLFREK